MVIIIFCWCFTTIILNSFSYISTFTFENVWRGTYPSKLELTCMNCSWVAELEQKQIFLPFYIPFKIFCLGLPAIHVYEIRFYLPTVLPCSRCDSHESMFSNLELAAAGSPSKLLHSTAQESQCHSISVPVWTAARYCLVLIFLLMVNGNNNILLMLYYYYIK